MPARQMSWNRWVIVLGLFLGISLVWGIALWIRPYEADGTPRKHSSHQQLGLPPCQYLVLTGQPCPSCGLTTSISLMVHGDLGPALAANPGGPVLWALSLWIWLGCLRCMVTRRPTWSARQEIILFSVFALAVFLMVVHWALGFLQIR